VGCRTGKPQSGKGTSLMDVTGSEALCVLLRSEHDSGNVRMPLLIEKYPETLVGGAGLAGGAHVSASMKFRICANSSAPPGPNGSSGTARVQTLLLLWLRFFVGWLACWTSTTPFELLQWRRGGGERGFATRSSAAFPFERCVNKRLSYGIPAASSQ
jgi:hypothetical protein